MTQKVLHISTSDFGGAGNAALNLHKALRRQGIDSKMLVATKHSDDKFVFIAKEANLNKKKAPKCPVFLFLFKLLRKFGLCLSMKEKYERQLRKIERSTTVLFTLPISSYDLSTHPLVQEADIIHLHWIQNYVDFGTFFSHVHKPIVWTFHDINPFYGGFHHYRLKLKYEKQYKDIEQDFYNIKKEALQHNKNLHIIALSASLKKQIAEHEIYSNHTIFQANNCVNNQIFTIKDKSNIRRLLRFDSNNSLFLFVNRYLNDSEKGLAEAVAALDSLNLDNTVLICVGSGQIPATNRLKIIHFNPVDDPIWLSLLYSVTDFLLFPSFQEVCQQTPIEAMLCGTPVITTPVGNYAEYMNSTNGVVCNDFTVKSIAEGVSTALNNSYDAQTIRDSVVNLFSPESVAEKHIEIYNSIIRAK